MPDVPDALHNQLALVTDVRNALYPNMVGKPLNDPKKAFQITKHVAWRLRAHGVGLVKAKPGSENNVEGFTNDIVALNNGAHWDILIGGDGDAFASWSLVEQQHWAAVAPRWTPAVDPGGVTPPVDPTKPDDPTVKALIATEVAKAIAPLQAEIAALKTMIAETWPASGATIRVALKSANGKYVCVEQNGHVIANRDAVGPWETLNVEPQ